MNVAVTRTKAEQALSELFEAVAAKLPGGRAMAEARKAAIGVFAGLGLPHRRVEEWKYTDLRERFKEALPPAADKTGGASWDALEPLLGARLAAIDGHAALFVNGALKAIKAGPEVAKGAELGPLKELLEKADNDELTLLLKGGPRPHSISPMLGLNTAFMSDGAVLRVPDAAVLDEPVHLVFLSQGSAPAAVTTRNVIEIGRNARVTIIESHVGTKPKLQANSVSQVTVGAGAQVTHVKVLSEGAGAQHIGHWLVRLGADAVYRGFQFTAGTALVRNGTIVEFAGEGAKIDLSGVFLGRGTEHVDTTIEVDHAVPRCESRELFKGVLADRARGVFQGKVVVRRDAQKTDGKQMAQALMLSEEAEFDSKPELEIHADDVVCGHGSTSAELDEDMLFYMRARGIPFEEARSLLIESFIGEAIDKIEDERLREALSAFAKRGLLSLAGQRV